MHRRCLSWTKVSHEKTALKLFLDTRIRRGTGVRRFTSRVGSELGVEMWRGNSRSINKRSENWTELGLLRLVPLCYVYQNVRQSIIAEEEWTKDLRLCGRLQSTCKLMRASGLVPFSRTYRSVGRIPSKASLNAIQTARAKFRLTCVTLEFTSFATKKLAKSEMSWNEIY